MMRTSLDRSARALRAALPLCAMVVSAVVALSCKENLPSGPATFTVTLAMLNVPDTLVVGDSRLGQAQVTDGNGHQISDLSFAWTAQDSSIVALAPDTASGRNRGVAARHTGRSLLTVALHDPRFVTSDAAKTLTSVVAGVRFASARDTAVTALNDTAVAVAAGLIKVNGSTVMGPGQGLRWVHRGLATVVVGAGDTMRYVARANGVDTLIATDDFCLAGAHCADTAIVRVSQQMRIALTARTFQAWSLGDSVGPSITLTDRRGNGMQGATMRFVPATGADAQLVAATAPIGTSDPSTGQMAAPKLVATGNGIAVARVQALDPGGGVVAEDTVRVTVRQVARRVAVEPLLAEITEVDSIPVRPNARDARGRSIADATITATATGVVLTGGFAKGVATGGTYTGTLVPALTGVADPANNPAAPQVPYAIDTARVNVVPADSAMAGATLRAFSVNVLGPSAAPVAGRWVRWTSAGSVVPDSVQTDGSGLASVAWRAPNIVARYTITGTQVVVPAPQTLADSAGLVVLRRSVFVNPALPDATRSMVAIDAMTIPHSATATITVTVRDLYGNPVTSAQPTDFVISAASGTIGPMSCTQGVCSGTYTAPGAAGPDTVTVTINGSGVIASPLTLTIT